MTKPKLSPIVKRALVDHRNKTMRAFYDDGFRVSEISWMFNCSPQLVSVIIKKSNKIK